MDTRTQWFLPDTPPERTGWYERDWRGVKWHYSANEALDWFDGTDWFSGNNTGDRFISPSIYKLPWRGLADKPEGIE